MPNYLLTLAYDGSRYHGWQMQDNCITVQGEIQNGLEKLYGEKIILNGCSRTDAGVHANKFCASFKAERIINNENIVNALNSYIPDDIVINECKTVKDDFHARFDCKGKEYIYIINNSEKRNPFMNKRALHYKYPLNAELMNEAASHLTGTKDFGAFCASGSTVKSTVRTVYSATVEKQEDNVIFKISGDGFLYNMVRIAVGTLIYVSQGKIGINDIDKIIEARDRTKAGMTVLPYGLYLNDVYYGGELNG